MVYSQVTDDRRNKHSRTVLPVRHKLTSINVFIAYPFLLLRGARNDLRTIKDYTKDDLKNLQLVAYHHA